MSCLDRNTSSPLAGWLARYARVPQVAVSKPGARDFFVYFIYLSSPFENFRTSPSKKNSLTVNIFPAKKMGIYVITYKARGYFAKNMPRRHLTDGPQLSDTLSICINTRFSLICKNLDECWYWHAKISNRGTNLHVMPELWYFCAINSICCYDSRWAKGTDSRSIPSGALWSLARVSVKAR